MEELREQQKEALQVSKEYLIKLIIGMESLVIELKGGKKSDTDDFMKQCLDDLNGIIQVVGRTLDLLNDGKERITKEEINNSIMRFNEAVKSNDDLKIAESMQKDIIMFLCNLSQAIDEVI
ncbi:MAG: molecular chaperone [Clostridiales bacterium]|nr:molecular chaperone [Clostridiales bacterium]